MKCYLCGEIITEENKHSEHIIPNGVAGKLQSEHLLHEKCGERLGSELDVYLAKKFSTLMNMIDAKKDRNGNTAGKFIAQMNGIDISCSIKNGKIGISGVFYDKENRIVYCNKKEERNLRKKFGDGVEYKTNLDVDCIVTSGLTEITDIDKKCLTKIAVEFALHCGVQVDNLDCAFDALNKEFKFPKFIPYYPINIFESFVEKMKWYFEKQRTYSSLDKFTVNSEYPSHSLHLFSVGKILYCFVSLFSYFEFYIVLSENFNGGIISQWHFESVVKTTPYISEYDLRNEDPKNVDICSKHWNESTDEILEKIWTSKAHDPKNGGVIQKKIYTEYKKMDCSLYMLNIVQQASHSLSLHNCARSKNELIASHIPLEIRSCLDLIYQNKDKFFDIIMQSRFLFYEYNGNDYFNMFRYKTFFENNGCIYLLPNYIETTDVNGDEKGARHRETMLSLVIASSELLYPSSSL